MILISPYCQILRNGKKNPKNFPIEDWKKLIKLLEGEEIIQIGAGQEEKLVPDSRFGLTFEEIEPLIEECELFISVDTFLPHMANFYGKKGVVIFSQSDPKIFGYPDNINILKHEKHLRENQFWLWEQAHYKGNAFPSPSDVYQGILKLRETLKVINK